MAGEKYMTIVPELLQSGQTDNLTTVRNCVIELYPQIGERIRSPRWPDLFLPGLHTRRALVSLTKPLQLLSW